MLYLEYKTGHYLEHAALTLHNITVKLVLSQQQFARSAYKRPALQTSPGSLAFFVLTSAAWSVQRILRIAGAFDLLRGPFVALQGNKRDKLAEKLDHHGRLFFRRTVTYTGYRGGNAGGRGDAAEQAPGRAGS